jgi:hypothetical protein
MSTRDKEVFSPTDIDTGHVLVTLRNRPVLACPTHHFRHIQGKSESTRPGHAVF